MLGAARRDSHRAHRVSHDLSRRKLCVGWHNQQLLSGKPPLGPIMQKVKSRLARFVYQPFKHVDFQRPDRVGCPFCPTFKLAGLVEKANIHIGGQFFSSTPTGLEKEVEGFAETAFSLIAAEGFLPVSLVTSLLRAATTSGSLLTHPVDRWPAGKSLLSDMICKQCFYF